MIEILIILIIILIIMIIILTLILLQTGAKPTRTFALGTWSKAKAGQATHMPPTRLKCRGLVHFFKTDRGIILGNAAEAPARKFRPKIPKIRRNKCRRVPRS